MPLVFRRSMTRSSAAWTSPLSAPERGNRIDDHGRRLEAHDVAMHAGDVHFEPEQAGTRGLAFQQAGVDPGCQVDADGAHVAHQLGRRFLEGEIDATIAAPARGFGEMRREAGLARARRTRHEDARSLVIAARPEHRVETRDAGRHHRARRRMSETRRGDGQHRNALVVDQERIFVGAMRRAPVFDDAQSPRGDLVDDTMIEQDHAVGNIFLEPETGQRAFAALGRDDGRHFALLQPGEQPPQLRPQHRRIAEAAEQSLQRVEDDAFGTHGPDGVIQPDEQAFEVVVPRFLDLAPLDAHVIHGDALGGDEARHVVAERDDVLDQVFAGLLETHEDARFVEQGCSIHEERHGEQRLAAAGAAADQRRATRRQAAERDLVEAQYAGGRLRQRCSVAATAAGTVQADGLTQIIHSDRRLRTGFRQIDKAGLGWLEATPSRRLRTRSASILFQPSVKTP